MTMVLSQIQQDFQKENKERKRKDQAPRTLTFYDSIYSSLYEMSQHPTIPKSKYRMTFNSRVHDLLIEDGFVQEVNQKKILQNRAKRVNVPHYLITPKGIEYIKRFEYLRELFGHNLTDTKKHICEENILRLTIVHINNKWNLDDGHGSFIEIKSCPFCSIELRVV